MVITIGNTKGGVGKSTTAWHLAYWLSVIQGFDTLLIDADDTNSPVTSLFTAHRARIFNNEIGYAMMPIRGVDISREIKGLRKKYEYIVIDTGATDNASLRAALTVSDYLVMPCQPRTPDNWISQKFIREVVQDVNHYREKDIPVCGFLTLADNRSSENRDTVEMMKNLNINYVLDEKVVKRKCFDHAFKAGITIFEMTDENDEVVMKAKHDLENLFKELFKIIKNEQQANAAIA